MEFEFDKEMDAILRGAKSEDVATAFETHPDADEIAAFMERAMSDASIKRMTSHFADCQRCRRILSTSFETPAAENLAAAAAPAIEVAAETTPWYRRLFGFPQLAFSLGALVIVFGGMFLYAILRGGSTSDMASAPKDKQFSKSEPMTSSSSESNGNAMRPANSAPAANMPVAAANTAAPQTANSNSTSYYSDKNTSNDAKPVAPSVSTESTPLPDRNDGLVGGVARPEPKKEAEVRDDVSPTAGASSANQPTVDQKTPSATPNPITGGELAKKDTEDRNADKTTLRSAPNAPKYKKSEIGATRQVSGKTFNNVGGIWFDSAYKNQPQTNVTRGTDAYRKLDAGLRAIGDRFEGTVVVVWTGKAYKIQ